MLGAVAFVLPVLIAAGEAECACKGDPPPIRERLRSAEWVFLGKATAARGVTQFARGSDKRRHGRWYPVVVTRTIKDDRPQQARQAAVATFDGCRTSVKLDKPYVFFADRYGTITRCAPPAAADGDVMRQLDSEAEASAGPAAPEHAVIVHIGLSDDFGTREERDAIEALSGRLAARIRARPVAPSASASWERPSPRRRPRGRPRRRSAGS